MRFVFFRPVFRRRLAGDFFENAIELRERLEADFKRDLTDSSVRVLQKQAGLRESQARDVIDELHAGHFLEFLAQVVRADLDEARHRREREFLLRVLLDVTARFPNLRGLGPISNFRIEVWQPR